MSTRPTLDELFDRRTEYPDPDARGRLARLVGLDDFKLRLTKLLAMLINPAGLEAWASQYHKDARALTDLVKGRPPLIVLSGDVGCGKTALAENIGDEVARQEKLDVTLFPMSLATRGQGRVGEMTQLVTAAFDHVVDVAGKLKSPGGKSRGAVILLIDEADALAQSREASQMHHEDRAGVNAFIRGIDRIANAQLPAAVLMCTNRIGALDPAVKRRAAEILEFSRPSDEQRRYILASNLSPLGFSETEVSQLVLITGPRAEGAHGFTFSDITQRLLPAIVLDSYPNTAITPARSIAIAQAMHSTPPFQERTAL